MPGFGFWSRSRGRRTSFDFTAGSLPAGVTYTGNGGLGTRTNSSGVRVASVADVARFDYSQAGASLGVLNEAAATNRVLRSDALDNASWTKTDTTITADAATGEDGTASLDLCTEGTAGTGSVVQSSLTITSNGTFTVSIDVKRGNTDWLRFTTYDIGNTANRLNAWLNTNTGAAGTVSNGGTATGAACTVESLGSGIYRFHLTGKVNNSATSVAYQISSASADAATGRVNNATYYAGACQLNAGNPTTYIPTAGSAVTRTADAFAWTATGGTYRITFDDDTTQDITPAAGAYTLTTSLNRARIKRIVPV